MESISMAVVGLVLLVTSLLSIYGLAPREGRPTLHWMKTEAVEILVTLTLVTLLLLGLALLFAAIA